MNDVVNIEVHGEVVLITLNRPKANAIDAKTSHALGDAFIQFRDNNDLRGCCHYWCWRTIFLWRMGFKGGIRRRGC